MWTCAPAWWITGGIKKYTRWTTGSLGVKATTKPATNATAPSIRPIFSKARTGAVTTGYRTVPYMTRTVDLTRPARTRRRVGWLQCLPPLICSLRPSTTYSPGGRAAFQRPWVALALNVLRPWSVTNRIVPVSGMSWSPVGTLATKMPRTVTLLASTSNAFDEPELLWSPEDWRLSQGSSCNPDTAPVVESWVTVKHRECRAVVPKHFPELPWHVTENTDPVLASMMVTEPRTFEWRGP